MDKRRTNQCLKNEPLQPTASDSIQWVAADSDTESLVQERAAQNQLRLNINHSPDGEAVGVSRDTNEDSDDDDLRVIDSLETIQPGSRSSKGYPIHKRCGKSQVLQDDAHSHLYCGPSGVGRFQEGPLISVDESFLVKEEKLARERKGVERDGYTLIVSTAQPTTMTPQNNSFNWPYLLHPQHGQTHTVTSPPPQTQSAGNHSKLANSGTLSKSTEEHGKPNRNQTKQTKTLQRTVKMAKVQQPLEDIVERNKQTLGRSTTKYGSYAKAHAHRPPQKGAEAQQAPKEIPSVENQSEILPQKTQQVKVSQRSKGKKAERKGSLIPTGPQQLPAPGVKAEPGDCLSSPSTKATVKNQNKAPSSSQPLAPDIQLSIDLGHTLHLPPFASQKQQENLVNLMLGYRGQHTNPGLQTALSPQQQTSPKNLSLIWDGHWNMESTSEQWQRVTALNQQHEDKGQRESPAEDRSSQSARQFPGSPFSVSSQSSSSYRVLPPIGRPGLQTEAELSSTQTGQRRESDGYLVQMEKKRLLRTRPAYKAYSLKDYRQLQPAVTLHGLGPDYTSVEKTKMRRQKLYSNGVREHNRRTGRMPRLQDKNPEAESKRAPRTRALEYAKTITKPIVPSQSKPKAQQEENDPGLSGPVCVDGLDLSQLTNLEMLRRRHEEEKRAVEQLRKLHAV